MIVLLLFLLPLLAGLISFFYRDDKTAHVWALIISFITLGLSVAACVQTTNAHLFYTAPFLTGLGSSFTLQLDGLSKILVLLTNVAYPIILISTWRGDYNKSHNFFALMLLTQAGLIGVFTSRDALLFYFFWELALIPVYFLCSGWGGERRIPITFKFFIYTFVGSILMLIGLVYLYFQTPDHSFALQSFYNLHLPISTQHWVFWLLFVAFAVKMPLFPLHTWQPDTYEESPTAVTMVLSAIMVKMGVYGVIRWVLPVVPTAAYSWGDFVSSLAVIGIIYASILAFQQNDLKRLVAYSSIAHVGIMITAIFAGNHIGLQGVMMQMFNHGINILGLWIVIDLIERQFGTRKISELGGLAVKAPSLALFLVVVALANISLPLTNAFVGEFAMFTGIFTSTITKYNIVFTVLAAVSIILAAVYTLNMIRRVFFGPNELTANAHDLRFNEGLALGALVVMIVVFGVYPQPILHITDGYVQSLLGQVNFTQYVVR
ncbi:MAG: complex I subunit 4 family protein [Candidatus Dadabacteria bacterium]